MPSDRPLFSAFPHEDYLAHQPEIDAAVQRTLGGNSYILGGEVSAFEQEFADYTGTRHSIGVANGTDAIELILRALGIGAGAKVAVPSHTAVASASGISRAGAAPVFVDIDLETFTLSPQSLQRLLESPHGKDVRAVLAVHLYGHPAAWEELSAIAQKYNVVLIEDCAQAHGATHHGRKVGGLGRAAAFSFYPTKNLGAIGDGGAITTNDADLADRIRVIRQYGWKQRYISECEGVNSRLDEIQAAILRVKLRTLAASIRTRRELAAHYNEKLSLCPDVVVPDTCAGCEHGRHLYVIRGTRRDALMAHLSARGIPVALHYPAAVHQQPAYQHVTAISPPLTNTELAVSQILTLPLHPYLQPDAVDAVCDAIADFSA